VFFRKAASTALDNVALPMIYAGFQNRNENKSYRSTLEQVNLLDRMDHQPNQLSGGQRQRGYCACFGNKTSIILADEYWKFRQQNPLEIMKLLETSMPTDTVILVTHEEEMPLMPTESFVCATDSLKAIQPNNFFSADPVIHSKTFQPKGCTF
jgi:ABC-type lipoprotein export system ATPase subunit